VFSESHDMPINPISVYSNNLALFNYASGQSNNSNKAPQKSSEKLSDEDERKVKELSTRDQDVRAHEAAHVAAGGQYVKGGATFSYQKGPDGKMYAVGGEVTIDTSAVKGDPAATIAKMETVKRAALAPADPSGQDRSVASEASLEESQARQQLAQQTEQKQNGKSDTSAQGSSGKSESSKKSSYNGKGVAFPQKNQTIFVNALA
jgi:hypothetical protein